MNAGLSRIRGSLLLPVVGTTWSSKTPTAATRKVSGTCSLAGSISWFCRYGIATRCSVSPGARCSLAAVPGSITASPAVPGPNICPCSTLTRSTVVPRLPSELASTSTWLSGRPPGTGSAMLYCMAVATAATCGSWFSAAK